MYLRQEEVSHHFIGVCPLLTENRVSAQGEKHFPWNENLHLLNGQEFVDLYKYVKKAVRYHIDYNV